MIDNESVEMESYIESNVVIRNSCGCKTDHHSITINTKQVEEIQSNYMESEQLLRILSYMGQELIFCQNEETLRHIFDNYLKQVEVENFYVYGFVKEIGDDQLEDVNNVFMFGQMVCFNRICMMKNLSLLIGSWNH